MAWPLNDLMRIMKSEQTADVDEIWLVSARSGVRGKIVNIGEWRLLTEPDEQ